MGAGGARGPPPFQSAWAAAAARPPGLAVLLPLLLNLLLLLLVLLMLLLLVLRLVGCGVGRGGDPATTAGPDALTPSPMLLPDNSWPPPRSQSLSPYLVALGRGIFKKKMLFGFFDILNESSYFF